MLECISHVRHMAGLKFKSMKSGIYIADVPDSTKHGAFWLQRGCPSLQVSWHSTLSAKLRRLDYGVLIENISGKLISWPKKTFSFAGRLEHIRTILQGIRCFWLSIIPIPCYVINKIYTLCRKFLWNSSRPPIAWKTLSLRQEDGRYGLRDLRHWNKALLSKTLWKIQAKKDTLWVKWITHHYGEDLGTWQPRKDDSRLLNKQLIGVRNEIAGMARSGMELGGLLSLWFEGRHGTGLTYDFFVSKETLAVEAYCLGTSSCAETLIVSLAIRPWQSSH
ncbi:ribonuclease H protein-like [Dorcoceras hygrometricum]|uniref:Ribonuclease H protein-like n=1 Tax=Dorcoceras hygrometricum TaxID=472368 RepID=A0A2Z7AGU4_9LAMI|nr:ribonuclease H protein-like [Dorcoceras hygrometricum]